LLGIVGYVAAAGLPLATADSASAAPAWFRVTGQVTRVVDGDTVHVRIGNKTERVRLIGIDAPERGACYATQATTRLTRLVHNRRVRLLGDRTQTRRDRFNRLLAYVSLENGTDVGRHLLQQGLATVFETRPAFSRRAAYLTASSRASSAGSGLWSACSASAPLPIVSPPPTATPPPRGNCEASYPDVCIPPPPPDLDCGQISFKRFRVAHTTASSDPHRFDGDRDGVGCES
jgi:micrococcal nuclease